MDLSTDLHGRLGILLGTITLHLKILTDTTDQTEEKPQLYFLFAINIGTHWLYQNGFTIYLVFAPPEFFVVSDALLADLVAFSELALVKHFYAVSNKG